MAWIKRNLFFVIGAAVALGLLVFAGYYNYTGWQRKVAEGSNLDSKYADLKRLNNQNPHPGFGKVDNIQLAREQQKEIRTALGQAAKYFQAPPAIPSPTNATKITSGQFSAALRETINQLSRETAGASVRLPSDFKFSFTQQFRLLTFAGSLEPLAVQLGEVKALCDVLIKAKVNSLDGIQRARVSPDDAAGPQTDYIDLHSETNGLAILTPYQITFRSFSPEIAQVLAGFANSPHGFTVQGINVEPAVATGAEQPALAPGYRPMLRNIAEEEARAAAARMTPAYPAAPAGRSSSQMALNEKQLRVTLLVRVVRLLPKK